MEDVLSCILFCSEVYWDLMMEIWENMTVATTINNKRSIAKHAIVRMSKTQLSLARVSTQ